MKYRQESSKKQPNKKTHTQDQNETGKPHLKQKNREKRDDKKMSTLYTRKSAMKHNNCQSRDKCQIATKQGNEMKKRSLSQKS